MGREIKAPKGYRIAAKGEKIVPGAIFRDSSGKRWHYNLVSADGRVVDGPGAVLSGGMAYAFPDTAKPAKPAPKAKWAKIPLDTNIAKSGLIDIANQLGAENARLKNQITKLKGAKA